MDGYRTILHVTHPDCLCHDTHGNGHPETPDRLRVIEAQLAASPLAPAVRKIEARPAERSCLLLYHDQNYLYRLEEAALADRSWLDHSDNRLGFDSFRAALLAAGAGLTAIDLLERGEAELAFCNIRPPGHHAEARRAMGFCFLNNAVIAARYWQEQYHRQRLLIVDWDAHHGNGIQAAFERDPDVLYLSLHEHPTFSFPGTGFAEERGSGPGAGTLVNIPLRPGSGDESFWQALEEQAEPAVDAFRPEAMIVCAGFDGHHMDDMSGLSYSSGLYHRIGRRMAAWGSRHCANRVLTILEGGYHLESLAEGVEGYLAGLAGEGPVSGNW